MKCPKCQTDGAYIGFNSAECPNQNCELYDARCAKDFDGEVDKRVLTYEEWIKKAQKNLCIAVGIPLDKTKCVLACEVWEEWLKNSQKNINIVGGNPQKPKLFDILKYNDIAK